MVGNVQFSLYGRGRHGSLRTGAVPVSEAGHALGRRIHGAGFLPSRPLPRASITPRQLLSHVAKWFKVLILLDFYLSQSCRKWLSQDNFCRK